MRLGEIGIWFEGCGLTARLANGSRQWSDCKKTKIGLKHHLIVQIFS